MLGCYVVGHAGKRLQSPDGPGDDDGVALSLLDPCPTLRNLAIGIIRHASDRTVNIAAATRQLARQLARQPDITLDLLGIPPLLCK
jgi:hypothetical protein